MHVLKLPSHVFYDRHAEQNRTEHILYLPNQNTAIMNKKSKYKWQATRRARLHKNYAAYAGQSDSDVDAGLSNVDTLLHPACSLHVDRKT